MVHFLSCSGLKFLECYSYSVTAEARKFVKGKLQQMSYFVSSRDSGLLLRNLLKLSYHNPETI